jgi:mitochondrial chaperone BCS1
MDIWVNFTHATKFKPSSVAAPATPKDASQQNLPLPKRKAFVHAIPILTEEEISELAKRLKMNLA